MPAHSNYLPPSQPGSRLMSPVANDGNNLDYHGPGLGSRMGSRIGKTKNKCFERFPKVVVSGSVLGSVHGSVCGSLRGSPSPLMAPVSMHSVMPPEPHS